MSEKGTAPLPQSVPAPTDEGINRAVVLLHQDLIPGEQQNLRLRAHKKVPVRSATAVTAQDETISQTARSHNSDQSRFIETKLQDSTIITL